MINGMRMSTNSGIVQKHEHRQKFAFFNQTTRNDNQDEDEDVDHAKKGRKVGREAMIPNDTVM